MIWLVINAAGAIRDSPQEKNLGNSRKNSRKTQRENKRQNSKIRGKIQDAKNNLAKNITNGFSNWRSVTLFGRQVAAEGATYVVTISKDSLRMTFGEVTRRQSFQGSLSELFQCANILF